MSTSGWPFEATTKQCPASLSNSRIEQLSVSINSPTCLTMRRITCWMSKLLPIASAMLSNAHCSETVCRSERNGR